MADWAEAIDEEMRYLRVTDHRACSYEIVTWAYVNGSRRLTSADGRSVVRYDEPNDWWVPEVTCGLPRPARSSWVADPEPPVEAPPRGTELAAKRAVIGTPMDDGWGAMTQSLRSCSTELVATTNALRCSRGARSELVPPERRTTGRSSPSVAPGPSSCLHSRAFAESAERH